tara:strand:+ start:1105 stop:1941 length:837 start_codon:yes stop_codon:yes gene_type:complete
MIIADTGGWAGAGFGNRLLLLNNVLQLSHFSGHQVYFTNFTGLDIFKQIKGMVPQLPEMTIHHTLTPQELLDTPKEDLKLQPNLNYKLENATLFELFFKFSDLSTFDLFSQIKPNITSDKINVGVHFRGRDFKIWDPKCLLDESYYINAIKFVIEEVKENFELTLYYDDIRLDSFKSVVKWLDDSKIGYSRGEITDRFNPSNWGQGDFFGLSQCDYIISSPSTFCVTAAMCGKKNKKIVHSKDFIVGYKLNTDYFRDIFWKTLYQTGGNNDYKLYKLI